MLSTIPTHLFHRGKSEVIYLTISIVVQELVKLVYVNQVGLDIYRVRDY